MAHGFYSNLQAVKAELISYKSIMERCKKWFNKYFDYDIVGEYLDNLGNGHYKKRYIKRYKLRKGKR